jgi:hypothetical protein
MRVPIVIEIGEFGSGKTLYGVYLGDRFIKENPDKTLFSNITLYDIPYVKIDMADLKKKPFPDHIKNGLIIIDEIQEDSNAYDFMKSGVRNIVKFVSQIRKRGLQLIMITPRLDFIAKKLREITNYIVTLRDTSENGIVRGNWFTVNNYSSNFKPVWLRSFKIDLSSYFDKYDTNEIVEESEGEDEKAIRKAKRKKAEE